MSIPPENYRYILEGARVSGPISKKDLEQASQFFQSLYDNGGPFYDKQLLRRVSRQLSDAVTSKTTSLIRVDGLDGEPVNFELQIGRVSPSALHRGFDSVACVITEQSEIFGLEPNYDSESLPRSHTSLPSGCTSPAVLIT